MTFLPCLSLQQIGEGEHFILRFTGPWASSGVANPSPSSHSSSWVLAYSPSLLSSLQKLTHSLSLSPFHSTLPDLATREVCGTGASIIDRASVQTWCRICGMWASSWGFEQGRHYVILHILRCLVHLYLCPFHRHTLPQTLRNTNTCHGRPRHDYFSFRITLCEREISDSPHMEAEQGHQYCICLSAYRNV